VNIVTNMSSKNLEIQSLRGYAIVLTVIAHLGTLLPQVNPYLSYFWLGGGVDLFFCISGFVIARGLLKEDRANFFEFIIPFFIKRVFRLWPAAIFWSFFVLFCSYFFNKSGAFATFEQNLMTAISGWTQVVNFKIVSCAYFNFTECSGGSPLRIYWSLSLEEQFYVLFPVLLFFLGDKKIVVLAFMLFVIQFFLYRPWPSPLWFFRTDAICLGVLIAWLQFRGFSKLLAPAFLQNKVLRTCSSILLCVLLVLVAKKEIVWFFNGLVVLMGGLLVYVASFDKGYFLGKGRVLYFSAYLGERSYSMYLTHMVSFVFIKEFFYRFGIYSKDGEWAVVLLITSCLCIFILSELSFRIIEQPLRVVGRVVAEKKRTKIKSINAEK